MLRRRWDQWYAWGTAHPRLNVVVGMTLASLVLAALHRSGDILRTAVTGVVILVAVTLWQKLWQHRHRRAT